MKVSYRGADVHLATGGKPLDSATKTVLFLHGSGQSHLGFALQTRYFASEGYNVLAPDFPGHYLSGGTPLNRIEDMADWLAGLMAELGIEKATVAGHSQGCLVALAMARLYPGHVEKLVLIAGALSIPVNDQLLDSAKNNQSAAIKMMTSWGHGQAAHLFDHAVPGQAHLGYGTAQMKANHQDALHADLSACQAFDGGLEAANSVSVPALVVLAKKDKMTPLKRGREMAQSIAGAQLVELEQSGHMIPSEAPEILNRHLVSFLKS